MVVNYEDFSILVSWLMLSADKISLHCPMQFGFHPRLWIMFKWHLEREEREKGRSEVTSCCEMWVCWGNMALLWLWITALSDPLCLFLAAQLPVTSRQPTHKHTRIYTYKQIHTIHAQCIKGMRHIVCTHKYTNVPFPTVSDTICRVWPGHTAGSLVANFVDHLTPNTHTVHGHMLELLI